MKIIISVTVQIGTCVDEIFLCVLLYQIYEIPFFVALDHKKEAVLVAVRGTLSLKVSAHCVYNAEAAFTFLSHSRFFRPDQGWVHTDEHGRPAMCWLMYVVTFVTCCMLCTKEMCFTSYAVV